MAKPLRFDHAWKASVTAVGFSEEAPLSHVTLRDSAFTVTNGEVTKARRLKPPSNIGWEITVNAFSDEAVTVVLPETTDCAATGAICTADGRPLSAEVSATVAGPPPPAADPLTVSYVSGQAPPAEHDGSSSFTFQFEFSEALSDYSYTTMRDTSLRIQQGATRLGSSNVKVSRTSGVVKNKGWTVTVTPAGNEAITIELGPTAACTDNGAMCTADGRALSNALTTTVQGPPGLSVADARVQEGANATVDFTVSLSRAASETVTVGYATSGGSATAGSDYTETSGTLSFGAGETSKTVSVPVIDDKVDEGEETFTLTLSNASNGYLTDAEATGTISNHDPLPRALLARFGRTAAVHVVEQVQERIEARREPGFRGRFAGRELRRGMERDMALGLLRRLGGSAGMGELGSGAHGGLSGLPGAVPGAAALGAPGHGGVLGMAGVGAGGGMGTARAGGRRA